jgi:hypothetical protein
MGTLSTYLECHEGGASKSMASTMKLYQGLLEHYDELLSHGVAQVPQYAR